MILNAWNRVWGLYVYMYALYSPLDDSTYKLPLLLLADPRPFSFLFFSLRGESGC